MSLRSVATACGLVGGLSWLVRLISDHAVLELAGFVLIGVASAAAGAALVTKSAVPLRMFVAIAFPLLLWSVLELVRDTGPDRSIDAGFGAAAMLSATVAWLRRPVASGRHAPARARDSAHRGE